MPLSGSLGKVAEFKVHCMKFAGLENLSVTFLMIQKSGEFMVRCIKFATVVNSMLKSVNSMLKSVWPECAAHLKAVSSLDLF